MFDGSIDFREFCILLNGIMDDTPLGKIIQIRSQTDAEIIKTYTPEQKQIRDEWIMKQRKRYVKTISKKEQESELKNIQEAIAQMFG